MSRAYLCVSIDVVGDEDRQGRTRRPRSFEGVTDGVVRRLHPFFERFAARPTYLLSPDVLRDPECLDVFRVLGSFSELGTHLEGVAGEREPLTGVTDLFIRAFSDQPQSFRAAGGLGSGGVGVLESLGYAVDGSVTPDVERARHALTQPWSPEPGSALLEVPVTTRRRTLGALPGIGRRIAPRSLRPSVASASAIVRLAEDELASARAAAPDRPVVLHATMRNVDVVPWASGGPSNEERARGVLDRLRALLVLAREKGISVVGLADVPEILRIRSFESPALSERQRSG
jgi:hypothetical protein